MLLVVSHEHCGDLQCAGGQQPARSGKPIGRDALVFDGKGAVQNADIAVSAVAQRCLGCRAWGAGRLRKKGAGIREQLHESPRRNIFNQIFPVS